MAKKPRTRRPTPRRKKPRRRSPWPWLALGALVLAGVLVVAGLALDLVVREKFAGTKWALPTHVFSRPLELYEELALRQDSLLWELGRLGYRQVDKPEAPGQYRVAGNTLELHTRPFRFWDEDKPAQRLTATFAGDQLARLRDASGRPLALARLEPIMIGGIYAEHAEDRVPVRLDELPPHLADALVAVEDRDFFRHQGVSLKSIARALVSNIEAGKVTQGGSTITQQLVKNFYLTEERTLVRKLLEAVMAVLLELHYSKTEILEAYINEIFLGQAGARAIHGFGMASLHYFRQPLNELGVHQVALLIAIAKGASWYDPQRHAQRARQRRDLVLDIMAEQGLIDSAEAARAQSRPLDIVANPGFKPNPFPAYLDLVKRQLRTDYREADLLSGGLRVFTNFDPQVQRQLDDGVGKGLATLEQAHRVKAGELEAAAVVVRVGTGEVLALAGGRRAGYAGFNRALDARRAVGSTIKPAVYLTALEKPSRYTLASLVSDAPISLTAPGGVRWQPENFDHISHGTVPLWQALSNSYNQATVRLGMELGVSAVIDTLHRLGYDGEVPALPSLFLGAIELSPFELAGVYHTIAAEGFYTPLRAIQAVYAADQRPLKRYAFKAEQRFSAAGMHLLQYALQQVVEEGTGKGVYRQLPRSLRLAGKTGTSNDQRDSWFSGFSGSHLALVWIGRDDNKGTPLTGGTGAVQIWARIMAGLANQPLPDAVPDNVAYAWVEPQTGLLSAEECAGARRLPFVVGSEPAAGGCNAAPAKKLMDWFKGILR